MRVAWGQAALLALACLLAGSSSAAADQAPAPRVGTDAQSDQALAPRVVTDILPRGPWVSEEDWADRLVVALGLSPAAGPNSPPAALFALLCPQPAQTEEVPPAAPVRLAPGATSAAVDLTVPEAGLYAVAVQGHGLQQWRAGGRNAGEIDPHLERPGFAPELLPLPAGVQTLQASLDPGSTATRVTLERYRQLCIEPRDGWSAGKPLRFGDKARTLVRALGLESRLPIEGPPQTIEGETFHALPGQASVTDEPLSSRTSGGAWVRADRDGAELRWDVRIDEPGVVTLLARVHGAASQIWSIGNTGPRAVRPGAGAAAWVWTEIATVPLGAGMQTLRVQLRQGAGVDVLRVLKRRDGDQDYLAVLDAIGVEEGGADELVDASAASANLANPVVRTLVAGFLQRLAMPGPDDLTLIQNQQERLYTRPLSPLLPAEM
ncbi:MAG TPA: hypothetical protein DEP35_02435 [Deltaproteobacteria bacterium]|nr:hypothetical protein [Deltaproteobacteria bacterium]